MVQIQWHWLARILVCIYYLSKRLICRGDPSRPPLLHGALPLHFIISVVKEISVVFDSMFKEVDLRERPPRRVSLWHLTIGQIFVWSLWFFQLNFTIIFENFNLEGGYALLIIKLIIKAEWVVLNTEKSLKKASAVTTKKLCKQTLLIYWALRVQTAAENFFSEGKGPKPLRPIRPWCRCHILKIE